MSLKGTIFDIQGFSVHDGPGCRTLIFLKCCSLRCKWCSNPEGHVLYPVPMYNQAKCISDGACLKACPNNAISIHENILKIDRTKCASCKDRKCTEACSTGAIRIAGYDITVDELFRKIRRDRQYWGAEGGITLTGGEPFCQPEFTAEILKRCHDSYIHTAVETCGNIPWRIYENSMRYIDWIFFDIKHIDNHKHIEATGFDNHLILDNACGLAENFEGKIMFRTTIVPGYNDSEKDMEQLALFLTELPNNRNEINILSLHHLGREKYKMLGKDYFVKDLIKPDNPRMEEIKTIFNSHNIKCCINSDTPF